MLHALWHRLPLPSGLRLTAPASSPHANPAPTPSVCPPGASPDDPCFSAEPQHGLLPHHDPHAAAFRRPFPDFSQAHPHAALEPLYRFAARWLIRLVYRPHYQGFEQLPLTGPGLIIANHVSYLDGLFINAASPRPIRYVIDKLIYEAPGVHYFMQINRAIPIYPKKEIVEAAMQEIANALQAGELVCIFPEGRLTYTGFLGRFKQGIEHIIQQTPVPVYPIGIHGLWGSIFSRKYHKARWPFLPRQLPDVRLVMGAAVPPEHVKVDALQREVMRLVNQARTLQ